MKYIFSIVFLSLLLAGIGAQEKQDKEYKGDLDFAQVTFDRIVETWL